MTSFRRSGVEALQKLLINMFANATQCLSFCEDYRHLKLAEIRTSSTFSKCWFLSRQILYSKIFAMLLRFLHKKHGDKYLHTAIQWVLDIQMFQKALTSSRQRKPQIETDYVDGAVCYKKKCFLKFQFTRFLS